MKPKTELMAFRLPADLAASIRAQSVGDLTITDVVIRMLRSASARFNYAKFHDGDRGQMMTLGSGQIVETPDAAPTVRSPVRRQTRGIRPKGDAKR